MPLTRRAALVGIGALVPFWPADAVERSQDHAVAAAAKRLAEIEAKSGGRLGVVILETGSRRSLSHRADERFPLCSTFKFLAVAAVLQRVDAGREQLQRKIAYTAADLLSYAPVTKAHVGEGAMSLGDLCAAAIEWSDNTAANLMLGAIGGPQGLTRYARSLGDRVTRLDRIEPNLNTAIPRDDRDTTSPAAMLHDLQQALLGHALSAASRSRLEGWMLQSQTGANRLRAGLPPDWKIGDKTGAGDYGTANEVAILYPPRRAPLLAAVYLTETKGPAEARDATYSEIGRLIAETF